MSQQHEEQGPTGELPEDGQQALSALRNVWQATEQTSADLDEACGNTTACKSIESVGFDGLLDEESQTGNNASVGGNIRSAWKAKLEREGKRSAEAGSVRDLVFGSESKDK